MTRIKICGITNMEDARAAIDYGADALGFIFVRESPRYVGENPHTLRILELIPPFVSKVAVCVSPGQLIGAHHEEYFDTVQFYTHDGHNRILMEKCLLQAVRIKDATSLDTIEDSIHIYQPHALVLDTFVREKLGGSGQTFNWDLAVEAKRRFRLPIILAGGLNPENVTAALQTVQPYAVDVSSGVEAAPGYKDHAKLRAFIQAVRQFDVHRAQSEEWLP
jgi:phosphoribosylanthranilate isomerase